MKFLILPFLLLPLSAAAQRDSKIKKVECFGLSIRGEAGYGQEVDPGYSIDNRVSISFDLAELKYFGGVGKTRQTVAFKKKENKPEYKLSILIFHSLPEKSFLSDMIGIYPELRRVKDGVETVVSSGGGVGFGPRTKEVQFELNSIEAGNALLMANRDEVSVDQGFREKLIPDGTMIQVSGSCRIAQ